MKLDRFTISTTCDHCGAVESTAQETLNDMPHFSWDTFPVEHPLAPHPNGLSDRKEHAKYYLVNLCPTCGEKLKEAVADFFPDYPKEGVVLGTTEGDTCNRNGCKGVLFYHEVVGCSCHMNPPCSACVGNPLTCPDCDWMEEGDV